MNRFAVSRPNLRPSAIWTVVPKWKGFSDRMRVLLKLLIAKDACGPERAVVFMATRPSVVALSVVWTARAIALAEAAKSGALSGDHNLFCCDQPDMTP